MQSGKHKQKVPRKTTDCSKLINSCPDIRTSGHRDNRTSYGHQVTVTGQWVRHLHNGKCICPSAKNVCPSVCLCEIINCGLSPQSYGLFLGLTFDSSSLMRVFVCVRKLPFHFAPSYANENDESSLSWALKSLFALFVMHWSCVMCSGLARLPSKKS